MQPEIPVIGAFVCAWMLVCFSVNRMAPRNVLILIATLSLVQAITAFTYQQYHNGMK